MSRELKFRAWDEKEGEMFYSNMYQDKTSMAFGLGNFLKECSAVEVEDTLMQFTGLYDINKIEIYEGDYMLDGHSGNWGEVKYIKGAFVVDFDGEYQDLYDWTSECVIGNIYENPDMSEYI